MGFLPVAGEGAKGLKVPQGIGPTAVEGANYMVHLKASTTPTPSTLNTLPTITVKNLDTHLSPYLWVDFGVHLTTLLVMLFLGLFISLSHPPATRWSANATSSRAVLLVDFLII